MYALAHATGRTGRFTLIERWRNNERLLAPMDHPLRVLNKWGEHANDVHLILQRTPLEQQSPSASDVSSSSNQQTQGSSPSRNQPTNYVSQNQSVYGKLPPAKPLPQSRTFPPPVYREPPRMPPPYRDPPPVVDQRTSSTSTLNVANHSNHINRQDVQPTSSDDEPRVPGSRNYFHGVKSPTPVHRRNIIKVNS